MGVTALFDRPYYTGVAISSEVPGLLPIGLAGHSYLIDLKSGEFKAQSIPLLRTQADTSNLPGEFSINPEDLWRRATESWHAGAGQTYFDAVSGQSVYTRTYSDPARFRTSKGVDPWTKWQLSLQPDTANKRASANTNLALAVAGSRLYLIDGTSIVYTTDITPGTPTWTAVTGAPGTAASSIASDGYSIYTAHGASGIYLTNRTTGATASWITGTVSLVRYVKGRLMAAGTGPLIYNVTTSTATAGPTALPTALNAVNNLPSDWTWVDFGEGQGQIYAAGYSGDKSLIYRITIRSDGTALDAPVVAGELPTGEIVRTCRGYLGFVALGTDKGVRLCNSDGQGNLTIGPLLNTGTLSVQCFEPGDRFIWFGWTNFDGTSTGLGRMDLSVFTQPLATAFASDLMATAQGTVLSIATFQSLRVFCVSGVGTFAEITNKVAAGQFDTGQMLYGIPDPKVAMFVDVRTQPLPAGTSYQVYLATDGGSFASAGTASTSTSTGATIPVGQSLGRRFEVRLQLNGSGTSSPTILRVTLRAYAAPNRGQIWTVPLIFHETIENPQPRALNPLTELNFIRSLISDKRIVTFQEGSSSHSVFVEDFMWTPHHPTADGTFWQGVCVVKLKEVAG